MSVSTDEKGNFMVVGSTGSGKTLFCTQMIQALLSGQRSDTAGANALRKITTARETAMTTRNNGGPGKTKQQMTRVFLARSDVSQIKALYSGEEGGRLAEAIRHNCNVWFPLNPGGNGNDA